MIFVDGVMPSSITAHMGGNELVVVVEKQLLGTSLDGDPLSGQSVGGGVGVGVQPYAAGARYPVVFDDTCVIWMRGERDQFFFFVQIDGALRGLWVFAHVGHIA